MPAKYTIESFDKDGDTIGCTSRDTLKEAKEYAKYMLTPAYKAAIETERDATHVEVRDLDDSVLWDWNV